MDSFENAWFLLSWSPTKAEEYKMIALSILLATLSLSKTINKYICKFYSAESPHT